MSQPSPLAVALESLDEPVPQAPSSATRSRSSGRPGDEPGDALDRLMELATMLDPEDWLARLSAQARR
jgi:hypothetical protein